MPQLDAFVWFDGALSAVVLFLLFQFGFAFLLLPVVVRSWVLSVFVFWLAVVGQVLFGYRWVGGLGATQVKGFYFFNKF